MKVVIVLALVVILGALFGAGVFMVRRPKQSADAADKRMARALALRVGVSVALFLLLLLSWRLGWIAPTGLPTGR